MFRQLCLCSLPLVLLSSGCVTMPDVLASGHDRDRHQREFDEAKKEHKADKVREMCATAPLGEEPPPPFNMIFKKWVNTTIQNDACAEVRSEFDAKVAALATAVKDDDSAACLNRAQALFEATHHGEEYQLAPWEGDDGRRTALMAVTEPCLAAAEEDGKAGAARSLHLALRQYRKPGDASVLSAEQTARLSTLMETTWQAAAASMEKSAAAASDRPLAQALFLSSAAVVHRDGGDDAGAEALALRAREVLKGAPADKLHVQVRGEGLAAPLVERVGKRLQGSDVDVGNSGVVYSLSFSPAGNLNIGSEEVELTASYDVQKGTRTNPDWQHKKERCDRIREMMEADEKSCEHYGSSKNYRCASAQRNAKDLRSCEGDLQKIKHDVPAFGTETVPYTATRFYGRADGTLTVRTGDGPQTTSKIVGSVVHLRHAGVKRANVSAENGGPVSESSVQASYRDAGADHVVGLLRDLANTRIARLLETAKSATDPTDAADAFVAYGLRHSPDAKVTDPIGRHLGLPLGEAWRTLKAH